MIRYIGVLLLGTLLLGCDGEDPATKQECYQLPVGTHLPRLAKSPYDLLLSYVFSSKSEEDTLMFTKANLLSEAVFLPLANGNDWFINWADFPSVAYTGETVQHGPELFYHFLQYSAEGTYDYDIKFRLHNGGGDIDNHQKLHQDTVSAEHGFLSSAAIPGGGLQVTWLDGRYTKVQEGGAAGAGEAEAQGDNHGHGAGGAMTLRTKTLSDSISVELDHRVCDCCNTATVATKDLTMVAYRDRSEHEIRDIGYVIKPTGREWSTPKLVHADNWEISGCPVNGPALAANDAGNIAVIWYTAPADRAQILFSHYDAALDTWAPPTLLDDNTPLGRVDLQLAEDGTAYATALTTKPDTDDAYLTLWTISPTGEVNREDLVTTSAARSSGFPKIALFQDKLYWARTVPGEEKGQQFVEVCWRQQQLQR
ncbi:hypothetical protein [Neolewinella persica]|uniref:hypothetical protein n=1 Tax=Neolewinella persica TaxID=70998 RepID=UPI00037407D9|nr:hypothetical protein [Neolewinella persica]